MFKELEKMRKAYDLADEANDFEAMERLAKEMIELENKYYMEMKRG